LLTGESYSSTTQRRVALRTTLRVYVDTTVAKPTALTLFLSLVKLRIEYYAEANRERTTVLLRIRQSTKIVGPQKQRPEEGIPEAGPISQHRDTTIKRQLLGLTRTKLPLRVTPIPNLVMFGMSRATKNSLLATRRFGTGPVTLCAQLVWCELLGSGGLVGVAVEPVASSVRWRRQGAPPQATSFVVCVCVVNIVIVTAINRY